MNQNMIGLNRVCYLVTVNQIWSHMPTQMKQISLVGFFNVKVVRVFDVAAYQT